VPVLSLITFLPLVGAIACALVPAERTAWPRWIALATTSAVLVLAGWLAIAFEPGAGFQFIERATWIPQAGIQYFLGADGISVPLVVLSALLSVAAVIASWRIDKSPRSYFALLLLLAVGMNGVFMALDFVLFYVFWELVLVPMYFLIAQWGGVRREYAAIKFFLYTLLGSVFILIGIVVMYLTQGTFDMTKLVDADLPRNVALWVFAAFAFGFAVKVPVWPFHTWLPDAHVEAPTAASVLLAGVLLKMGTYGFLRVALPMLPGAWESFRIPIAVLAVIGIVYGAAVAFAQTDMKKLVAYSSVSHMGFAMLGIASGTAAGLAGTMAVNIAHGINTGLLFLLVGMVYERTHTREIAQISGLANQTPRIAGILGIATFASMGLPGLSGFVGEFLSLVGAWSSTLPRAYTIIALAGVLLAGAYMLWLLQRVLFGQPSHAVADITDATPRELAAVLPLVALTIVLGLYWDLLLRYVDPAVTAIAKVLGA